METVPAATQVYLSKGRIADMVRADSGIFMAMAIGVVSRQTEARRGSFWC